MRILSKQDYDFIHKVFNLDYSIKQAYIETFKPTTDNDDSIRAMASRSWNREEIQSVYKEAINECIKNIRVPREQTLEYLQKRANKLSHTMHTVGHVSEYRKILLDIDKLSSSFDKTLVEKRLDSIESKLDFIISRKWI